MIIHIHRRKYYEIIEIYLHVHKVIFVLLLLLCCFYSVPYYYVHITRAEFSSNLSNYGAKWVFLHMYIVYVILYVY